MHVCVVQHSKTRRTAAAQACLWPCMCILTCTPHIAHSLCMIQEASHKPPYTHSMCEGCASISSRRRSKVTSSSRYVISGLHQGHVTHTAWALDCCCISLALAVGNQSAAKKVCHKTRDTCNSLAVASSTMLTHARTPCCKHSCGSRCLPGADCSCRSCTCLSSLWSRGSTCA